VCELLIFSHCQAIPPLKPLYVAADSHCLSSAWRVVRWRGEARLLAPVLVTGLKAWHLREGSDFFPKANFDAAVGSIPDGAQVWIGLYKIFFFLFLWVQNQPSLHYPRASALPTLLQYYCTTFAQYKNSPRPFLYTPYTIQYWS